MNRIRILPDNLANQIAAGEVVERPASVIKELIENSLDADAKRIKIEIELGGRRLMRVTDDGVGMSRDDSIIAFERHATSKISELEDLAGIETLGFRGEALASIASVAKVELSTRAEADESATRVSIEGGKLLDVSEAARPPGTTIAVKDLFFNTPARRKFMRSQATENYHITSTVTHYALANPEIAFTLTNNGRESLRAAPARSLRERAYQLFGNEIIESLLPVSGGQEYVATISGFVSAPRERRTTRDSQYFFINGRFVKDKIISGGLLEGFRSVLPHGVYPVAFLFLEVPLEEIDVNVHPAKSEVRFRRAQAVKQVIAKAVRDSLKRSGVIRADSGKLARDHSSRDSDSASMAAGASASQSKTVKEDSGVSTFDDGKHSFDSENLRENEETGQSIDFEIPATSEDFEIAALNRSRISDQAGIANPDTDSVNSLDGHSVRKSIRSSAESVLNELPPTDSAESIAKELGVEDISASRIMPVGQLHESFIIAVDNEGLLLIDQHVAHERILFDQFRNRELTRSTEGQNLLVPETIDLTPAQSAVFDEIQDEIERAGFSIMKMSGRSIAIKSVPTDLPMGEVRNLFSEILDTVEKDKQGTAKATLQDDIAASMACKAAVKINMNLTPEKMRWMIDKLLTTSSPTTCPHGRPVILRLSMKDIERKFHRT